MIGNISITTAVSLYILELGSVKVYPNMIYINKNVLKKEGHIVSSECHAYLGGSVKMVAGQRGTRH